MRADDESEDLRALLGGSHVEEDSSRFSHAFSENAWTVVLKVEFALRD